MQSSNKEKLEERDNLCSRGAEEDEESKTMDVDSLSEGDSGSDDLSDEDEGGQQADNEEEEEEEDDGSEEDMDEDDASGLNSPHRGGTAMDSQPLSTPLRDTDSRKGDEEGDGDGDGDEENDQEEEASGENEISALESIEMRRADLTAEVGYLESEFASIKNALFTERLRLVESKLAEVREGRAAEYLTSLAGREENCRIRKQVAQLRRDFQLESARNIFENDTLAADHDAQAELSMLYDHMRQSILLAISRQEAAPHPCAPSPHPAVQPITKPALTSPNNGSNRTPRPSKRLSGSGGSRSRSGLVGKGDSGYGKWSTSGDISGERGVDKRNRGVLVTGPYIVYMLHTEDIMNDLNTIKTALKAKGPSPDDWPTPALGPSHRASHHSNNFQQTRAEVRCEPRRLHYNGEVFTYGCMALITFNQPPSSSSAYGVEHKANSRSERATLVSVSSDVAVFKNTVGHKRRVPLGGLRKGKITLQRLA